MTKIRGGCAIDGCTRPHYGHGWCNAHWNRWRAHGDPLAGRTPRGELARFYREVVLTYDGDECLIWPYQRNAGGYGLMGCPTVIVSRRLCEEVHGPAPTPDHDAAHSCGNGHVGCVAKRHLSWKTKVENSADRLIHGTHLRGERQNGAKLTEPEVHEIRVLKGKISQREIAERFGVHPTTISNIYTRKIWSWLDQPREEGLLW